MQKLHIKKGDTVMIIAGDSRGQQGKVLDVHTDTMRADKNRKKVRHEEK
jgi:large subunit ribosomal protein L24